MEVRRSSRLALLAASAALLVACSAYDADAPATTATAPPRTSPGTFDPAASARVFLPGGSSASTPAAAVPVLVLVPGGGWQTHDSSGLVPLAESLSAAGYVAVTTEYRAGEDGVGFPDTVHDVLCSAAYAVAQAEAAGYAGGPVILVGHSAGGHLAALAAVSDGALAGPCADPVPTVDGVVGLAGIYDTRGLETPLEAFFGVPAADDPALWDSGDPIHYVRTGQAPSGLRVLLLHGDADGVVPLSQSRAFAQALEDAGIDVELQVLPGQDHMGVFSAEAASAPIRAWLA